jgi:hypothetical protein
MDELRLLLLRAVPADDLHRFHARRPRAQGRVTPPPCAPFASTRTTYAASLRAVREREGDLRRLLRPVSRLFLYVK